MICNESWPQQVGFSRMVPETQAIARDSAWKSVGKMISISETLFVETCRSARLTRG